MVSSASMYELIPLIAGCAAGWLCRPVRRFWLAAAVVVLVGIVAGTLAATISGELDISPAFLLWDIGQGAFAGMAVLVVARRLAVRSQHA